jgi:hypothetical protein
MTTLSRITLVSALLALLPAVAPAADKVTRTRMLASDGINAILIQARVGSVRLEPGEGNAIEAKVTLEAKRNSDPVSDLPDVTKVQMSATTRGDQLRLGVDEKNIEEHWIVRVPKRMFSEFEVKLGVGQGAIIAPARRITLDIGVGDAKVDAATGAITVRVGTGNAELRTARANAGAVEATTGVGGLTVKGVDGKVERHMVGGSIDGKGRGREPIEAKVGVGDVTVTLTE